MKKSQLAVTLTASALLAAQPSGFAADIAATSKADLKTQLAAQQQGTGAQGETETELYTMCYLAPFEVTEQQWEYVCPVCGERTAHVYAGYTGNAKERRAVPDIDECRRLFTRIPATAGLKLDESEYCRKCSPRVKQPEPALLVPTAHGQLRRVRHVTSNELRQLGAYFTATPTEQEKMRKDSRRLRKLLGR
jgi:hypothetical protein